MYKIDGQNYFFYSSTAGPESPDGASLWVSKMYSPTSIGPATLIAAPSLSWEFTSGRVLEGPAGITSPTGEVFIVYSADDCNTPAYKLGGLRLTRGADPLLPASWTKLPNPLLETDASVGQYGTGHNGFFKSPDRTEDWIVYHANRAASGRCDANRQSFVQKVTWNDDGTPNLGPLVAPGTEITPPSGEGKIPECKARRRNVFVS